MCYDVCMTNEVKLTEAQLNILDALRTAGKRSARARGFRIKDLTRVRVELSILECYDGRSVRGLFDRGLLAFELVQESTTVFVNL